MTMIHVIQDDIDSGAPRNEQFCPIACAARRSFEEARCYTEQSTLEVYSENRTHTSYCLPPEAIEFITRFDTGQPVEPFTFEV